MAKDLRYYLKFDSNGRKLMDELGISSKQLDEALGKVGKTSKKTHQSLMSMASVTVIVEGVTRAIDGLHNTMRELANANAVQVEAETKLLTIMKQRMDATNEEFESIKRLASAQQELGIIGDEVQLMGAQQLATFLNHQEALQMLIPAMNNLVAQQKGYNATTSDAVSIGNLFGKVMQGQISALSRVGITFTDVQQKILQTGTELEKAATLAQVVTDNVGNMNEALAQTEAGKLKQVENAMGDQKEVLGGLVACFMPYISRVNEAIKAGAHIVTVTNAFESLTKSVFGAGTVQKTWNMIAGVGRTGSLHLAAALRSVGASAKFIAASANVAKVAIRGLLMASGVGVAIAALTTILDAFTSSANKASKASKEMSESMSAIRQQIVWDNSTKGKQLSSMEIQAKLDEVTEKGNALRKRIRDTDKGRKGGLSKKKRRDFWSKKEMPSEYEKAVADQQRYADWAKTLKLQLEQAKLREAGEFNTSSGSGLVNETKDRIKDLEKLRDAAKTKSEVDKYNRQIEAEKKELAKLLGESDPKPAKTGLINDVQAAIGELEDLRKSAKTVEEISAINERIKTEKEKLEALQNVIYIDRTLGKVDAKPTSLEFDPGKVAGVKLRDLQKSLGKGYMLDVKLMPKLDTKPIEAVKELKPTFADLWGNIQGVAGGFDTITGAIENSGSAWEKLNGIISGTLQIFQSMSQVIPMVTTLTQALIPVKQQETAVSTTNANANANEATAKLMSAHAGIPWVGIAIAGGMLAAMTAMMFAMPKFAKGGIAYGPTLGLFGEYAGASNNPEVVAPLDRLRSLIRPADSGPGRLTATLKGRDIQIVYERRKTFESTM